MKSITTEWGSDKNR